MPCNFKLRACEVSKFQYIATGMFVYWVSCIPLDAIYLTCYCF